MMNITKEQLISTITYWYEKELTNCERSLKTNDRAQANWIDHYIKECLGVAFFVQELDLPFDEINPIYENIRERFEKLRENFLNDRLTS